MWPTARQLIRRRPVLAGVLLTLGLGACAGPVPAPDLGAIAAPGGFTRTRYPAAGVSLGLPRDWVSVDDVNAAAGHAGSPRGTLLAVLASGPAIIALWRDPRTGPAIPATATGALTAARDRLIAAARARDRSLTLLRSGLGHLDGVGTVILDAVETVGTRRERVRSEHVYVAGAELVLETYAPPARFAPVDHAVFSPVRRSLTLSGRPVAGTTR